MALVRREAVCNSQQSSVQRKPNCRTLQLSPSCPSTCATALRAQEGFQYVEVWNPVQFSFGPSPLQKSSVQLLGSFVSTCSRYLEKVLNIPLGYPHAMPLFSQDVRWDMYNGSTWRTVSITDPAYMSHAVGLVPVWHGFGIGRQRALSMRQRSPTSPPTLAQINAEIDKEPFSDYSALTWDLWELLCNYA